jgi:hypothetical protein
MARLRLLHWKAAEAAPRIELLRKAGHEVQYEEKPALGSVRAGAPQAIVIDLSRMPSQGREVAIYLRGAKATRHIPLVFTDGDPEKVAQIRELIPDATYTRWDGVLAAIKKAISKAPVDPVVPPQMMTRYGDRPVAQKLGIKPGTVVTLIDAPRNYEALLGEIPDGVQFEEGEQSAGSVTLWFIHDAAGFQASVRKRRAIARHSKLWIVWPKGESGKRAGITQNVVRATALQVGLVDYKICSVNETWSAILFAAGKGM